VTDTEMKVDESVNAFLEHFGKKGMRWGLHKAKKGDWKTRSGAQKTGLVIGGAVGYDVTGAVVSKILGNRFPLAQVLISGVGAVAGVRATRNVLQHQGSKKISSLPAKKKAA
jgi:hypothetical protein